MGIENGTGTKAVVVSGRNSTAPWTATNEAWLFTPNSPYGIVSWTPTNGLSNSTILILKQVLLRLLLIQRLW
ncbi:MAG: hypothetical protein IPO02_10540 [Bacteroidetes bacterium]|nr:hypothetical protein [Bacteroidota bacterium]